MYVFYLLVNVWNMGKFLFVLEEILNFPMFPTFPTIFNNHFPHEIKSIIIFPMALNLFAGLAEAALAGVEGV